MRCWLQGPELAYCSNWNLALLASLMLPPSSVLLQPDCNTWDLATCHCIAEPFLLLGCSFSPELLSFSEALPSEIHFIF